MRSPMPDSNHQEKNELQHVLASGIFAKAPRQAKLLKYICEESFQGRDDQIKEYTLATEVLGRPVDFDQNRDAIVRVEVHRLRKKLKEYYEGEGAGNPIEIVIDAGHYVPKFIPRDRNTSPAITPDAGNLPSNIAPAAESPPPPAEVADRDAARHTNWPIVTGGVAIAAVVVILLLWLGPHPKGRSKASLAPSPPPQAAQAGMAVPDSVRIICGYPHDRYIDRAGNVWLGDRYFSGGDVSAQPMQYLARAPDVALYQSFRFGDFSYDIPLQPGNYELHLYFVETHYGTGSLSGGGETSRMFDIYVNGNRFLRLFDIIKDAGGNNLADERVFSDITPAADHHLHLQFQRVRDSAILNALAVLPAPAGRINPIRILAQNNSYTDREGNIWSPDRYYLGGLLALHLAHGPVKGTSDPGLYSSERYGNFSYAIPVPPGKYKVTLRMAETYWGIENTYPNAPDQNGSPVGGADSRLFDVYCNGTTLLKNFNLYKDAGGPLQANDKTFHHLQPDAQGKLVLNFVPVRDYAVVNAIEVETEPK